MMCECEWCVSVSCVFSVGSVCECDVCILCVMCVFSLYVVCVCDVCVLCVSVVC